MSEQWDRLMNRWDRLPEEIRNGIGIIATIGAMLTVGLVFALPWPWVLIPLTLTAPLWLLVAWGIAYVAVATLHGLAGWLLEKLELR